MAASTRNRLGTNIRQSMRQQYAYVVGSIFALSFCTIGLVYWQQLEPDGLSYFEGQYTEGLAQAELEGKLCFVKFEADFCYPCQELDSRLKKATAVAESMKDRYLFYQINPFDSYSGGRDLAKRYEIEEIPTILITDELGQEITRISGVRETQELMAFLDEQAGQAVEIPAMETSHPVGFMAGSRADSAKQKQHFGLEVGQYPNFVVARRAALERRRSWSQAIWIQQHPWNGRFQVIIGAFAERRQAKLTKRFLKVWEGESCEIVSLRPAPLPIPTRSMAHGRHMAAPQD